MYSSPNFEPVPCSVSGSNCCFWIQMQVSQTTGKVVWYTYLFKNFLQFVVVYTVKGFTVVNDTEVDISLKFPAFSMIQWMLAISSPVSLFFSKSSLYIWKFSVHVLLQPSLKDFRHCLVSKWNECSCVVVWTFSGRALLCDLDETDISQSCGHCWVFQICWHIECSTLTM